MRDAWAAWKDTQRSVALNSTLPIRIREASAFRKQSVSSPTPCKPPFLVVLRELLNPYSSSNRYRISRRGTSYDQQNTVNTFGCLFWGKGHVIPSSRIPSVLN